VTALEFRALRPADVYAAREALSLGGGHAVPIVSLDGRAIGDGKVASRLCLGACAARPAP